MVLFLAIFHALASIIFFPLVFPLDPPTIHLRSGLFVGDYTTNPRAAASTTDYDLLSRVRRFRTTCSCSTFDSRASLRCEQPLRTSFEASFLLRLRFQREQQVVRYVFNGWVSCSSVFDLGVSFRLLPTLRLAQISLPITFKVQICKFGRFCKPTSKDWSLFDFLAVDVCSRKWIFGQGIVGLLIEIKDQVIALKEVKFYFLAQKIKGSILENTGGYKSTNFVKAHCPSHHFPVLHEWLSNSMPLKPPKPSISITQLTQIHAKLLTNPKPHIFNPLLGSLVNSTSPENGLFLYNQMLRHPSSHNHFTFTYALKACCFLHQTHKGLEIHAHLIKSGHLSDIFIQNSLLHFYILDGDVPSASQIFDSILNPDVVSWTSIISGLSKLGFEEEALDKFLSMNVRPNSTTLVTALSACSSLRCLKLGKAIHGLRLRSLNEESASLDNALLDFYVRCGYLRNAENLFEEMPKRDVVSWTTMIGGYAQRGLCEEAVRVFQKMVHVGEAMPNEATLINVLSACSSISALHLGQWVHSYINARHDVIIDGNVGNALINMYVKCGSMEMANLIFRAIKHKDIISWSTIISGLAMNGLGKQAFCLFSLMLVHGISPDDIIFLGLLSACSHGGLINQGLMVFEAMKDVYNISPQMKHYACMVDLYGKAGLLDEAETFIKEMPIEAEGPVWGALLHACLIHGNEKKYEKVRQWLLGSKGVTVGTVALLSNTYASCDRWNDANELRDTMRSKGLKKMAGCSWIELVDPSNPLG